MCLFLHVSWQDKMAVPVQGARQSTEKQQDSFRENPCRDLDVVTRTSAVASSIKISEAVYCSHACPNHNPPPSCFTDEGVPLATIPIRSKVMSTIRTDCFSYWKVTFRGQTDVGFCIIIFVVIYLCPWEINMLCRRTQKTWIFF